MSKKSAVLKEYAKDWPDMHLSYFFLMLLLAIWSVNILTDVDDSITLLQYTVLLMAALLTCLICLVDLIFLSIKIHMRWTSLKDTDEH